MSFLRQADQNGSRRWVVPATAVTIVVVLWIVGVVILGGQPDPDSLPSRIAIGKTDDGAALRVIVEGCDTISVSRVTVSDEAGRVVWEVRGFSPPSRTNFVIGQTADPMTVTQSLTEPLRDDVAYRVAVESDAVETLTFTLRSVPPVGVLHEGREMTSDGFRELVTEQRCRGARRLPFAGSVTAQLILILAGAAFAVVAAGLVGGDPSDPISGVPIDQDHETGH